MNVLLEINNIIQAQSYNYDEGFTDEGESITKDKFREKTTLNYNRDSIDTYFTELLKMGYLEAEKEHSNKYKYKLTNKGKEFEQIEDLISEPIYYYSQLDEELINKFKEKDNENTDTTLFSEVYQYFNKPTWLSVK